MTRDAYIYTAMSIIAALLLIGAAYLGNAALFYGSAGNFPGNEQQMEVLQQRFLLLAGLSVACLVSFFIVMRSIVKRANNKYRASKEK